MRTRVELSDLIFSTTEIGIRLLIVEKGEENKRTPVPSIKKQCKVGCMYALASFRSCRKKVGKEV